MDYSLTPYRDVLVSNASAPGHAWFALVDGAQLDAPRRMQLARMLSAERSRALFEDSLAKAALELSPTVVELDPACSAWESIDLVCKHLPVLALLRTSRSLDGLTLHLRERLLIEADGAPFMLRLADTQMLAAANIAFTPEQRASFFDGIDAWLMADHQGCLHDAADRAKFTHASTIVKLPLQLDSSQVQRLLDAAAAPALASQLRQFDPRFAHELDHAQQTSFAHECIVEAQLDAIDMDAELLTFALQRWQAMSRENAA